jgi:hypothetical protein
VPMNAGRPRAQFVAPFLFASEPVLSEVEGSFVVPAFAGDHKVTSGQERETSVKALAAGARSTSNPPAIARNIISINPDENDPV